MSPVLQVCARRQKKSDHARTINPHLLFWKLLTNIWTAKISHLTPPASVCILAPLMALTQGRECPRLGPSCPHTTVQNSPQSAQEFLTASRLSWSFYFHWHWSWGSDLVVLHGTMSWQEGVIKTYFTQTPYKMLCSHPVLHKNCSHFVQAHSGKMLDCNVRITQRGTFRHVTGIPW